MSYKVTRYYSSSLNKTVAEVTYESGPLGPATLEREGQDGLDVNLTEVRTMIDTAKKNRS